MASSNRTKLQRIRVLTLEGLELALKGRPVLDKEGQPFPLPDGTFLMVPPDAATLNTARQTLRDTGHLNDKEIEDIEPIRRVTDALPFKEAGDETVIAPADGPPPRPLPAPKQ